MHAVNSNTTASLSGASVSLGFLSAKLPVVASLQKALKQSLAFNLNSLVIVEIFDIGSTQELKDYCNCLKPLIFTAEL